ncbi:MAG TPA: carboxypeptidase regulatory-like domain-containing protein [Candidatus Saccharimonadales bacterium]|jgi:Carboxypeptidase regulatory-like domain|nr:carboxypeptidase regulatory-like domain-containing protein [Candidatus Saccharimonadales bacterium]
MRALVVLALVLAACGQVQATPGSGIRGTILAGPACPGPVRLDSPCPDRPVAMTVEVVSGTTVTATVTTDAAGKFSVGVAPGTYTLRSKTGLPTLKSSTVVVVAGQFTDVELHADTGIR